MADALLSIGCGTVNTDSLALRELTLYWERSVDKVVGNEC